MDLKNYKDFIPKSDIEAAQWLYTYVTNFPEAADVLLPHMTAEERTQYLQEIKEWIEAIYAVERLNKEKAAAVKKKAALRKQTGRKIRDISTLMKRSATKDESLLAKLGILYKATEIDLLTLKPKLKATVTDGAVKLHFYKQHKFGISVYCRKPGGEWVHIGNEFEPPFIDKRPLAIPFQAEDREYMAMYNNIRETIGQQSDIIKVVCGTSSAFQ